MPSSSALSIKKVPETLVNIQLQAHRNIPEDPNPRKHRSEALKRLGFYGRYFTCRYKSHNPMYINKHLLCLSLCFGEF